MEQSTLVLEQYGYLLLFALGFFEFIGAPIAAVPVLIAAGGLAAAGGVSVPGIVVAVALGGLMADIAWYSAARFRGRGLVDTVCGLSSNPKACVTGVERRVASVGSWYLLPAKFIPGAGNMVAAASGFAPISLPSFLVLDSVGLLVWASAYTGLGWVFSAQVEQVIQWAGQSTIWLVTLAGLLIGGAGAWRVAKVRMHRVMHQTEEALEG